MEPFIPTRLPLDSSQWNWEGLIGKVSAASASLAYYSGILATMINPAIFLSPLETKEAVISSHIEGTRTTLDEAFRFDAGLKPENETRKNDLMEVINYRTATRCAKSWLDRGMPFNKTMMCEIQKELLSGVRGKDKKPGIIRNEQVWIGPGNCKIEDATFVPPEPLGLADHLDNLFTFIHADGVEPLIQTAIMHAQFELIHPFMDGNGRTGRILIPLFLWHKKRLKSPMFYISEYLDKFSEDYTANLLLVSQKNDWERWVAFFLDAIDLQAQSNAEKANQVLQLYNEMKDLIVAISNSPNGIKALDTLFSMPIFRRADFKKVAGLNPQTVHRIITRLKNEGLLTVIEEPSGRSPEILLFEKLFRLISA